MKLTERVYLVGGSGFGYSPDGDCNIYLIDGKSEYALIDTGGGKGVQKILQNIRKMGMDPQMIETAILTHCHFDHIGGNHELKTKVGCSLAAHKNDIKMMETLGEYVLYDMAKERGLSFESESVDIQLSDGDLIEVGDIALKVLHTPGHTPGCISLVIEEKEGIGIFSGDIASSNGKLGFINGPGFNLSDWKSSIKKLISKKPKRLYPGHNTFLLGHATEQLELLDQKMNAPWVNIVTSVG